MTEVVPDPRLAPNSGANLGTFGRHGFCAPMLDKLRTFLETDWQPVSRWALAAWVTFYVLFLGYAFQNHGGFLFIDLVNLVVHEGGHLLFGWLGPTLGLWGGTLLQWLVPFMLAAYFFTQRQTSAFVFCAFFFLRTGFIRRPIWRMRGLWLCRW